jgi:hypothetical protein
MTDTPPIPEPPRTHAGRDRHRGQAQGGSWARRGRGMEGGDDPWRPKPPPMAIPGRISGVPTSQPLRPGLLGRPFLASCSGWGLWYRLYCTPAGPIPPDRSCSAGNSPAKAPPLAGHLPLTLADPGWLSKEFLIRRERYSGIVHTAFAAAQQLRCLRPRNSKSPLNVCLMSTGDGGGVAYHATRKNAADCLVSCLQNPDEH